MKISKYIHSCLLLEKQGFKLLIDPGKFSFADGLVKPEDFKDVDAIIITHNHPDHLDKDNLSKILALSKSSLYTNAEVAAELFESEIESTVISDSDLKIGPFNLQAITVKHEPILDSPLPEMTGFIIDGRILHPVDSFEEKLLAYEGIELLILPVMAPFTTELKVADFADKLKPLQILPVHDGYAKDFFLKQRYETFEPHFTKQHIIFHQLTKPGSSLTLADQ